MHARLMGVVIAATHFLSSGIAHAETLVDFFDAIAHRQITAEFIPVDSAVATVLMTNQTNEEIAVRLPDAFVGVPILAQFGQGIGQGGQQGQQGQNGGGGQAVGGGGQNQGIGQGIGQQGNAPNGLFRIPPEKTIRWRATTVCLQHGRPEPNPRMKYRIAAVDTFTNDTAVIELCRRVGSESISQTVAQAAAWHLASGLPWEEIAAMNRIESQYTGNVRYFTDAQIESAKRLAEQVIAPEPSYALR